MIGPGGCTWAEAFRGISVDLHIFLLDVARNVYVQRASLDLYHFNTGEKVYTKTALYGYSTTVPHAISKDVA